MNKEMLRHVVKVNDYVTEKEHQIAKLYLKRKYSKKEMAKALSIPKKEVKNLCKILRIRVRAVHKCDMCSSTMRAFCKSQTHPETCNGPWNW